MTDASSAIDNVTTESKEKRSGRETRKQLRGSSLLMLGRFISLGTNFLTQVLMVRYLAKADYGAFAYALSLVMLGEAVVTFGLDRAVTRFVPIYDEQKDYSKLFGTLVMVIGAILSLSLGLLLLFFSLQAFIDRTLINDTQTMALLGIMIFLSPLQAIDTLLNGMFAVFSSPKAIFFRRYIIGPALRITVVLLLTLGNLPVDFLALGYMLSGLVTVLIFGTWLYRIVQREGLIQHFDLKRIEFPVKAVLSFTVPLLASDLLYMVMGTLDAVMLGSFQGTEAVASFRAVLPLSKLNRVVLAMFGLLYTPVAARMFAKGDKEGINNLYWQNAIWTAVLSFPIFAVTFSIARPVTLFLFEERYESSAAILALLSLGYYFDAALGQNGLTLKVLGKVRYIVVVYLSAAVVSVVLNLIFIPIYGAFGAAMGTAGTLLLFNLMKQSGLLLGTGINPFDRRYRFMYVVIVLGAGGLLLVQTLLDPPVIVAIDIHGHFSVHSQVFGPQLFLSLVLAGVVSLLVVLYNKRILNVEDTFPELLRIPILGWLLKSRDSSVSTEVHEERPVSPAVTTRAPIREDVSSVSAEEGRHWQIPLRENVEAATPDVLRHAVEGKYTPGSNVKGAVAGANWVFLLPRLDFDCVVCLGAPPADALPTLAFMAQIVILTVPVEGWESYENVRVISAYELPAGIADYIYLSDGALVPIVHQILKPRGLVYYEYHARDQIDLARTFPTIQRYWLTPTLGRMQTAVPIDDTQTANYITEQQLYSATIREQTFSQVRNRWRGGKASTAAKGNASRVTVARGWKATLRTAARKVRNWMIPVAEMTERLVTRQLPTRHVAQRQGVLLSGGGYLLQALPEYLQVAARSNGIDLSCSRWSFSATGDYSSQKLLFFLFAPFYLFKPEDEKPEMVVKMVRDPRFNDRLEREYHGLVYLERIGFGHDGTCPSALFLARHHNLAIVGESAINGQPFDSKTDFTATCLYAWSAVDWLIELSVATRTDGDPVEVSGVLWTLFERFVDIYQPDDALCEFLAWQIDRISEAETVPLVFQHGDPGIWNLLVTPDDKVAFLDWENAEPQGMPLWDLIYFLNTYCGKAGRASGNYTNLAAYEHFFLQESRLQPLIVQSIREYCEETGLSPALVEPLYYLSWMYRALKQAAMTEPERVHQAYYWKLLRLAVAQRDAPTLRQLFG